MRFWPRPFRSEAKAKSRVLRADSVVTSGLYWPSGQCSATPICQIERPKSGASHLFDKPEPPGLSHGCGRLNLSVRRDVAVGTGLGQRGKAFSGRGGKWPQSKGAAQPNFDVRPVGTEEFHAQTIQPKSSKVNP